jgi:leader peptidase (prepilin peptidase)/N-methyltransferase
MIDIIGISEYFFVFVIGSMVGSFLNVCIYRIPRNESIVFPASHCPKCGGQIGARDNIPVLSFLLLRGKCRCCRAAIPLRYPLIEITTALLILLLFAKYQMTLSFVAVAFFVCVLIVVSAIDLEHMLIPNKVILPGIAVGIPLAVFSGCQSLMESMLGFVIGGGLLLGIAIIAPLFFKEEALGGGDIKLAAFMGIFLGRYVVVALFISFLLGGLGGIIVMLRNNKGLKDPLTFGPFLSSGALFAVFYGMNLWVGYMTLIGLK